MLSIEDIRILARAASGRQLDGGRKTNARWAQPGTELRDGVEHAGWWAHLSLRRRAGIRLGALLWVLAHGAGLVLDLHGTVISLRVEFWLAFAVLVWVVVHRTRKWSHRTGYVVPVAAAVAEWLGMSRHVEPASLVTVPLGHRSNPDKPVRIHLPPTFREPHRRQQALATMVAARAGIRSHDWEVQLEGAAPMMLVRAALVPPDEVFFADPDVRALIDGNTDDSRLLLGLGVHSVPMWLDLNQDSPHVGLSIGSGGGKSTTVRALAGQVVYQGGRAVLMDGGKDGESHQDWARDEHLVPTPGVDFYPSIAEEHDALVAWEAERARRARGVLDRTGEQFQRTLIVLEERNLTTPKLAAYWAAIRDKSDPVKSPAIQAQANLVAAGRSVKMNCVAVAQRFDAACIGGGSVRASFQLRVLSRFDDQARKMLIPEIKPAPKSSNHLGRSILCVNGEARDVQGLYMSTSETLELCRAGADDTRMSPVVVRPRTPVFPGDGAERPVLGRPVLVPSLPYTDVSTEFDDEPADAPWDEPENAPSTEGVDDLVTLSQAWQQGTVGGSMDALRKAAQRPGFPPHEDEGARGARLYRRSVLAAWWVEKLDRADVGGGAS